MSHHAVLWTLLAVFILVLLFDASAHAQGELTVDWIFGPEAIELTALPAYSWLSTNTLLLYDRRKPPSERSLELLDPATGVQRPAVDAARALSGMRSLLGEASAPRTFPQPLEVDLAGTKGLYLLRGDVFVLDFATAEFARVTSTDAEEKCAAFSPNGRQVSYVRANNLFVYDLETRRERALTRDGSDSLLNGTLSWVYWEEVFGRRDIGYWWSKDASTVVFLRTEEAGVSIQHYVDVKPWTPRVITQRYPKVGEKNPVVTVGIADLVSGETRWVDLGKHLYEYLVRVKWLPDDHRFAIQTMNRLQTELDLFVVDATTGKGTHVLTEKDSGWVNVVDDFYFLKDGKHLLWASERDGYKHLYRYTLDGTLVNRVTRGPWALRTSGSLAWVDQAVTAIDESNGWIYFTALEKSSLERHLYRVRPDGEEFMRISREAGTHQVGFSPDARWYVDRYSTVRDVPVLRVHRSDGTEVRYLGRGKREKLASLGLQTPKLFTIPARDGFALPAQILRPADFDSTRKYPVIFFVYGGPSAPQVLNQWQRDIFWENLLTRNGYLVARVDPRSATAISKTLENLVARRLMGDVELHDLVDAVRWMKAQPFVDSARIGVWGWSGGGSYTMLAMTRSREFKAGIAVAGVSDQRFYDTKWGEAAMKTEKENKAGYEDVSLVRTAKDLSGRLMIVHGSYDDNVHIQNAWAFIDELIKANKQFDLMVYPMRMHGISDRAARVHLYTTMLEFWRRNL